MTTASVKHSVRPPSASSVAEARSSRPTVVRVVTRLNIGGVAVHAILLTRHIGKRNGRTLLVAGEVDPHEGNMLSLASSNGIRVMKIATLRNGAGLREDLASFISLYRLFRRERPSIADLHMTKARVLGGIAARLAGVPVVLETFHGTLFEGYYGPVRTKILVAVERMVARLMDGIIAVSEAVAADLAAHSIAPRRRIHVIPPGLDLDRFDGVSATGRLHASLGVDDTSAIVGVIARLVPIKGLETFVASAALVARDEPKARFVIIGDGPERTALELQTKALGLGDRLALLGWRRDIETLYQDIDVVVLPSKNEGTPVTVIEAMAAGRAVVATRVGGVPDVVTSGVNGVLVPADDVQALAAAIVQLLRDPKRRREMGEAARQTAKCRFSIERLVTDTDRLYQSLLAE